MSKSSDAASPLHHLASLSDEWKYGRGKNLIIVRSSSAVVSVAASTLLVWIIFRSRDGTKTTYHRLLLGLSVSDILLSLSFATFGAVVPSELSYLWNARGGRGSCDAFGFLGALGGYSGLLYMCSLNLYYLAKVKFNKTDTYIAKKLEPWLRGVPPLFGLIMSIVLVTQKGMNASIEGYCSAVNAYDPPHCDGYEDGDTPKGFEIPCGRGRAASLTFYVAGFITLFLVPITIGISLWIIYKSVSRAERRIGRYGAGSLSLPTNYTPPMSTGAPTTNVEGEDTGGRGALSMLTAVIGRFGGRASASRTSSNNQDSSQSRAVLQRAAAYSVAYFVTWIWLISYGIMYFAGVWTFELPWPKWQIAFKYVDAFFTPHQGLWTFLIYMQPNVIKRKRSSDGNMSWFKAFGNALWSAATDGNNSTGRGQSRSGTRAPRTAACTKGRSSSATVGFTDQNGVCASVESVGLEAEGAEEEKREIQDYEPAV